MHLESIFEHSAAKYNDISYGNAGESGNLQWLQGG